MPESGLPIRVYEEHDMWHVDYGEGETEDHTSREEAEAAADAVAQAEERTVVARNNDLVAMLTSLDKFDHAAVVGCCARRAEISVALPPKGDGA